MIDRSKEKFSAWKSAAAIKMVCLRGWRASQGWPFLCLLLFLAICYIQTLAFHCWFLC